MKKINILWILPIVFISVIFGIVFNSITFQSYDLSSCFDKFDYNRVIELNSSSFLGGGISCYERDGYIDLYYDSWNDKLTYYIRCYDDIHNCILINSYVKIYGPNTITLMDEV